MIRELFWVSDTSRANVQPRTEEINSTNLHKGRIWWFEWDTNNRTLQSLDAGDRDDCPFPKFVRECTTTLLYCEKDGFSSIPYNPIRDKDAWPHWWSLGFNREDRKMFRVERDDTTFETKKIPGNGSGWFHLFRDTQHDDQRGGVNSDTPLLTGDPSLVWALAAFQFNAGTLSSGLPDALRRDGHLHVHRDGQDNQPGSMGSHLHQDVYRLTLLRVYREVSTCVSCGDLGTKEWTSTG